VQLLLGHSKLESTVKYLGIEVDDALEIAEQTAGGPIRLWLPTVASGTSPVSVMNSPS
jgi:hypothetical protein